LVTTLPGIVLATVLTALAGIVLAAMLTTLAGLLALLARLLLTTALLATLVLLAALILILVHGVLRNEFYKNVTDTKPTCSVFPLGALCLCAPILWASRKTAIKKGSRPSTSRQPESREGQ
jgi:hypothetical protein